MLTEFFQVDSAMVWIVLLTIVGDLVFDPFKRQ